jgi:hypothetical protein
VLGLPDASIGDRALGLAASLLLAADALALDAPGDLGSRLPVVMSVARALARTGMGPEAARLTAVVDPLQRGRGDIGDGDSIDDTVIACAALCEQVLLRAGDAMDAVDAAPVVAGALEYLQRRSKKAPLGPRAAVFQLGSWLLRSAGESRAADASHRVWTRLGAPWPVPLIPLPPVPATSAGADLLPSDPMRLADETLRLLEGVVSWGSDGSIAVLSSFPSVWEGQPVDVRAVPTPNGPLSFSVRWHGSRPALLWECERRVDLTCPALDRSFRASGASGEALLRR